MLLAHFYYHNVKVGILLYCGQCGQQVQAIDKFCGNCGAPTIKQQVTSITIPKIAMTKKTKITSLIIIGILGFCLITYSIAHYTNGPSSPKELEGHIISALAENDTEQLVKWLDPNQPELKQPDILNAFNKSMNDTIRKRYESAFRSASAAASAKANTDRTASFMDNNSLVQFVNHSNWRGTRWSFHVTPAQLEYQKDSKLNISLNIGQLKDQDGKFPVLWPSIYKYEAEISNSYASETTSGSVDLIATKSRTLTPANNLKTKMSIFMPQANNLTYLLNGKPLEASQQNVMISPAPKEAKLQLTGKILGKTIEESITIDTAQSPQINLSDALNKGVSKIAVDVIYDAALSWTKADNAGDTSLLRAADPDGSYYLDAVSNITKPSDNKTTLIKVAVDPKSIRIKDNLITIDASEHYLKENNTYWFSNDKNSIASWNYTLQKVPDKDEAWIVSHGNNGFFGRNIFNVNGAVVKNNPDINVTN
jgi:hypothetical protein